MANSAEKDNSCVICRDGKSDFETRCGHFFHENCLEAWLEKCAIDPTCPICRRKISSTCTIEKIIKKCLMSENCDSIKLKRDDVFFVICEISLDPNLPYELLFKKCLETGWKVNDVLFGEGANAITLVCRSERLELLKHVISLGGDCNYKDLTEKTPLHFTILSQQVEMVKFLTSKGANTNGCTEFNSSLFHAALLTGNCEIMEILLKNGLKTSFLDKRHRVPLITAIICKASLNIISLLLKYHPNSDLDECLLVSTFEHDIDHIRFFVEKGANVNHQKKESGLNCLKTAAFMGKKNVVEYLIAKGADVNMIDIDFNTALLTAALDGNYEMIKLLVKHGACLNIFSYSKEIYEFTPMQAAISKGHMKIAEFLFDSGANFALKTAGQQQMFKRLLLPENSRFLKKMMSSISKGNKDIDIIHAICERDNYNLLLEYIDKGYDPNGLNSSGFTPLFYAKEPKIIEKLIEKGADVNFVGGKTGLTPFLKACQDGNMKLFKKLMDIREVNIVASSQNGFNALHFAVESHNLEMVKILLKLGVNAEQVNADGLTPLCYMIKTYSDKMNPILEDEPNFIGKLLQLDVEYIDIMYEFKKAKVIFPPIEFPYENQNLPFYREYNEISREQRKLGRNRKPVNTRNLREWL